MLVTFILSLPGFLGPNSSSVYLVSTQEGTHGLHKMINTEEAARDMTSSRGQAGSGWQLHPHASTPPESKPDPTAAGGHLECL